MARSSLPTVLSVICLLSTAPAALAEPEASGSPSAGLHFDSMRYFILNPSRQAQSVRGLTYINLIGDLNARRFKVYYEGDVTGLRRSRHPRLLRVLLMHAGNVVGTVTVANLSDLRGGITLNKRLTADCIVIMREVDEVDARLEP